MGFDKLSAMLGGLPVLRRTVEAFLQSPAIGQIVVVGPEDRWSLLDGMDFTKPVTRVDGGAERQVSVALGLAALGMDCQFVAVHDGARPLISPDDIGRCVDAVSEFKAVSLGRRVTETMKRSDEEDFCAETVSREHLWCMETPQVFEIQVLREAYLAVTARGLVVTDEVSAVHAIGTQVKFIASRHPNLKITTPADLALAEALLRINP